MNKGFTLLELLAVIILLAVVATIAAISGMSILNDSKTSLSKQQENMILEAAKNYQLATGTTGEVTLETLSTEGYLDSSDLKDPADNKQICGYVSITYDENKNQYYFSFEEKEC